MFRVDGVDVEEGGSPGEDGERAVVGELQKQKARSRVRVLVQAQPATQKLGHLE